MNPEHYHRMLIGLDGLIEIFKETPSPLSPQDMELKFQLAQVRAFVLRAESGHPFPFAKPTAVPAPKLDRTDPELTQVPFSFTR